MSMVNQMAWQVKFCKINITHTLILSTYYSAGLTTTAAIITFAKRKLQTHKTYRTKLISGNQMDKESGYI